MDAAHKPPRMPIQAGTHRLYSALLGALKVIDEVEVALHARAVRTGAR